jgi:hypothetical protein
VPLQERAYVAAFCAKEEKENKGKRGAGQPPTDLQPNLIVLLYSCGADGRANPRMYNRLGIDGGCLNDRFLRRLSFRYSTTTDGAYQSRLQVAAM